MSSSLRTSNILTWTTPGSVGVDTGAHCRALRASSGGRLCWGRSSRRFARKLVVLTWENVSRSEDLHGYSEEDLLGKQQQTGSYFKAASLPILISQVAPDNISAPFHPMLVQARGLECDIGGETPCTTPAAWIFVERSRDNGPRRELMSPRCRMSFDENQKSVFRILVGLRPELLRRSRPDRAYTLDDGRIRFGIVFFSSSFIHFYARLINRS